MESKLVTVEVIGKTAEARGWVFKKMVYVLAIKIPDANPPTVLRSVPFDQYASIEIGQHIDIVMYRSKNGWAFSEREAMLSF